MASNLGWGLGAFPQSGMGFGGTQSGMVFFLQFSTGRVTSSTRMESTQPELATVDVVVVDLERSRDDVVVDLERSRCYFFLTRREDAH